jgi:hypothetical protein
MEIANIHEAKSRLKFVSRDSHVPRYGAAHIVA